MARRSTRRGLFRAPALPTRAASFGNGLQHGRAAAARPPAPGKILHVPSPELAAHVRRARALRRQTQAAFAAEVGLSVRTLGSIEAGERRTYDETTIARVESALGWAPGSVGRVVNGQSPVVEADPYLARIRDAWPRLSEHVRRMLADLAASALRGTDGDDWNPDDARRV